MALFFDSRWFEARLASLDLTRADLALAGGLTAEELRLVFKDQREVSPGEIDGFAALLGVDPDEIAARCGVTTHRKPRQQRTSGDVGDPQIADLEARVAALEQTVALLLDQAVARKR